MKKSLYLKLSQQEANRKIQLSLAEKHQRIKQKNRLLGFLYFIAAYIWYSSVAIISFMYRWSMISKDFRFTPHYLQIVIDYKNMDVEEANQYLNTQLSVYKKSRSYGNFSLAERDTINTTFEILFEKYKLPEPTDNKHLAVMFGLSRIKNISLENNQEILDLNLSMKEASSRLSSQMTNQNTIIGKELTNILQSVTHGNSATKESVNALSEEVSESVNALFDQNNIIKDGVITISQSVSNSLNDIANVTDQISELSSQQENSFLVTQERIDNVNNNVELVKSTIEPIASYTNKKREEENAEEERIIELKDSQEKRSVSAYNRAKGKKLSSFESVLTDKQITILVEYCNEIAVFDRDIEFQDMKQILLCTHQKPLKLSVNKYLAFLFSELSDNKLICKTWKSVVSRHKCFVSSEDKTLTSNDLYMANQTSGLIDPDKYDLITECVEKIIQ